MTNCQIQCLHCQTAMWVCAIAYAKAKNIKNIAAGYKAISLSRYSMSSYSAALDMGVLGGSPMTQLGSNIGTRIRRARQSKNLTRKQLAERLGVSASAIEQWESNRRTPDNETWRVRIVDKQA